MARFILIPGAMHGGWCWEKVVPFLEAAGHEVLAPDLPGTNDDPTPFSDDILAQWADFVADLARKGREPAILVGHSRAGVIISEAAERAPEAVRRLVGVAAILAPDGMSVNDCAALEGADEPQETDEAPKMSVGPDGLSAIVPEEYRHGVFYHLAPADDVPAISARLRPEPLQPLGRPVRLTAARFGSVPRAYILAEHDRAISAGLQRMMIELTPCDPVIVLPSDHSPFYSMPERLARELIALA